MAIFFPAAWPATSTTVSPLHESVTRTFSTSFHLIRWSLLVAWMPLTAGLFYFNPICLQHLKIYLMGSTLTCRLLSWSYHKVAGSEFSFSRMVTEISRPEWISLVISLMLPVAISLVYFVILWTWLCATERKRKEQGQENIHWHDVICYLTMCVLFIAF